MQPLNEGILSKDDTNEDDYPELTTPQTQKKNEEGNTLLSACSKTVIFLKIGEARKMGL